MLQCVPAFHFHMTVIPVSSWHTLYINTLPPLIFGPTTWPALFICVWHSVTCDHTSLLSVASRCKFDICLQSNGLTSFHPDGTHTSKHCFVFILWIVNDVVTIAKTSCNVVLQCLLIYYGYYIWIYLMTQDIVDFIVFFSFFFLLVLWLFRALPLKKEIITTEHTNLVELNSDFQLK